MGRASRRKWKRREVITNEVRSAIEKERNSLSLSASEKPSGIRENIHSFAKFLVTGVVPIILGLLLTPFLAHLMSHNRSVTVSYAIRKAFVDCDYYMIGIHPSDNTSTIKSMTLRLRFPAAIQSLAYGTDHTSFKGKPAIEDVFDTEPPCDVKPPIKSDLPSSVEITRPGQANREVFISAQNFDPSTSFMLMVGAKGSTDPRLTYTGQAFYSAWNQEVSAPINLVWINEPH